MMAAKTRSSRPLAMSASDPLHNPVDTLVTAYMKQRWGRRPVVDALMVAVGKWTPALMLLLIGMAAFGLLIPKSGQAAAGSGALAIVSATLARAVNEPVSRVFHRPRPFELDGYQPLLLHDAGQAFPSNHATGAFALAVSMFHVPAYGAVLVGLAVFLCLSRVYNGLHHLSDVVAGALHGTLVALVMQALWLSGRG